MDFLDFISEDLFELMGVIAGLVGCSVVLIQVVKEWTNHLSVVYCPKRQPFILCDDFDKLSTRRIIGNFNLSARPSPRPGEAHFTRV